MNEDVIQSLQKDLPLRCKYCANGLKGKGQSTLLTLYDVKLIQTDKHIYLRLEYICVKGGIEHGKFFEWSIEGLVWTGLNMQQNPEMQKPEAEA